MKTLILNGSPKGERSDTLCVARAFVEGMREQATVIDLSTKQINPCKGCFACWHRDGCMQKDDMGELLA